MKRISPLLLLAVILFIPALLFGQPTKNSLPFTFTSEFTAQYGDWDQKPVKLPKLNLKRILQEDKNGPDNRFAAPIPVDLSISQDGQWRELSNGDRVWQLKIQSKGAIALAVLYSGFYLPPGSSLHMFSEDHQQVIRYDFRDNPVGNRTWTGLIESDVIILEYYEPSAMRGVGRLEIFRVDHAYHKEHYEEGEKMMEGFGFGESWDCHQNINCPEGMDWQKQKRGVCRILLVVEEGMGFCSGSLMNNTSQDLTPYILSAFHCQDGYTPLWDMYRFDFNYEGNGCNNPAVEPEFNSLTGSFYRSGRQESDFILLELINSIPSDFGVYYNGWDRRSMAPVRTTMIHHPKGDIKKISQDTDQAVIYSLPITWDNGVTTPSLFHLRCLFDLGTHESGSSGSALFNQYGLVVGQLHGGTATCQATEAFFGRFFRSWSAGNSSDKRLREWLDPLNSQVDTLLGLDMLSGLTADFGGTVLTEAGEPVSGVTVSLYNGDIVMDEMTTDAEGVYLFEELEVGEIYGLQLSKNTEHANGVSTQDLIKIRRQILGLENLDSPFKQLAADVNASESVSTLDMIKIRRIILGVQSEFEEVPSWQFFPTDFAFTDPNDPFLDVIPPVFPIVNFIQDNLDYDIYGMKSGDVNDSADPAN